MTTKLTLHNKNPKARQLSTLLNASMSMNTALEALSSYVSSMATTSNLVRAFNVAREVESTLEDILTIAKKNIIKRALEDGHEVGESGSRVLDADGMTIEIRRTGAAFTAKQVEALFRSKGIDPGGYMDEEVRYSLNADKLERAIDRGLVTREEIEALKKDQSWAVQRPVEAE